MTVPSKLGGAGDRFGDYLCGLRQFSLCNTQFTKPITKISMPGSLFPIERGDGECARQTAIRAQVLFLGAPRESFIHLANRGGENVTGFALQYREKRRGGKVWVSF